MLKKIVSDWQQKAAQEFTINLKSKVSHNKFIYEWSTIKK